MANSNAIGVFDSGIGGLTVVRRIQELLPNENIVYLGDTARVPYGPKSEATIKKFTLQSAEFLVKKGVKCIVLACNTASAHALEEVQTAYPEIPVIGMIETGAAYAASLKFNNLLLIGTAATVNSHAYAKAINVLDQTIKTNELACPLFVPLVEEGLLSGKLCEETIAHYLASFSAKQPEAIILGCTHYPLLKDEIQKLLPAVELIDSGEAAAIALRDEFAEQDLANNQKATGFLHCLLTSPTDKFRSLATLCLTRDLDEIHYIDLD